MTVIKIKKKKILEPLKDLFQSENFVAARPPGSEPKGIVTIRNKYANPPKDGHPWSKSYIPTDERRK